MTGWLVELGRSRMILSVWVLERNGEGDASTGIAEKLNAENEEKEGWMNE